MPLHIPQVSPQQMIFARKIFRARGSMGSPHICGANTPCNEVAFADWLQCTGDRTDDYCGRGGTTSTKVFSKKKAPWAGGIKVPNVEQPG
ncbi:hypothetical protein D3C71_1480810 [compost metagenome]